MSVSAVAVFKTDIIVGDVLVTPHKDGVKVQAHFTKLPPGKHGFHIHKAGDLRGEGCHGLCEHYDVGKNSHGGSNLHWALSAVQLLVGVIAVIPLWLTGIRKSPKLTLDNWKELAPVGLFTSLAHAFSVLALGAGAVSLGQIVKAGEPVFAAATNAVLLGVRNHIFLVICM
jgi:hypothetical protein